MAKILKNLTAQKPERAAAVKPSKMPVSPKPPSAQGPERFDNRYTRVSRVMLGRLALPIPRQEFVEPVNRVIGNVAQHVGEPSLRIDVVHLGGDDQAVHERRPLASAIGAGE